MDLPLPSPRIGLAAICLLLSCDLDAPVGIAPGGADPGQGTGTLHVAARVAAEPKVDNAQDPSQFETELEVRVTRAGSPVSGATVRVGSSAGVVTLTPSDPGSYTASQPGYWPSYALEIQAGTDSISGASLDGPAAHTITSPTPGTVHPAGQPLEVKWTPTGADEATIETDRLERITVADTGSYNVAGSYLHGSPGEDEEDRVRVTRARRLDLGGGEPGSTLTVSVRNEVELVIRGN